MNPQISLKNAANVEKAFSIVSYTDDGSIRVSETSDASFRNELQLRVQPIRTGKPDAATRFVASIRAGIFDANGNFVGYDSVSFTFTNLVNGVLGTKRDDNLAYLLDFLTDHKAAFFRGEI